MENDKWKMKFFANGRLVVTRLALYFPIPIFHFSFSI